MPIPRPTKDDLTLAASVCNGDRPLKDLFIPEMHALARALPELAERAWFGTATDREDLLNAVRFLIWPWVLSMRNTPALIPWTAVAASAMETVALLERVRAVNRGDDAQIPVTLDEWREVRRPAIYALLDGGVAPGRVVLVPRDMPTRNGNAESICRQLGRSWFDAEGVVWTLDNPAHGNSAMVAWMVRLAAEYFPKVFDPGRPIGLTGELGPGGAVLDVSGVPGKLNSFFTEHSSGICFGNRSRGCQELRLGIGVET